VQLQELVLSFTVLANQANFIPSFSSDEKSCDYCSMLCDFLDVTAYNVFENFMRQPSGVYMQTYPHQLSSRWSGKLVATPF
jgi:hypothetical protein